MIHSMTAFSRVQQQVGVINLVCEIRSINHRYLDINIYLPEALRALEMSTREYIRKYIKRGKIECQIRYQLPPNSDTSIVINESLAKELCLASEKITTYLKHPAPISSTDILRFPGMIEAKETEVIHFQTDIFKLLESTLKDLLAVRAREGEELKQLFLKRLELIKAEIEKIKKQLPQVLSLQKDRLEKRFKEIQLEFDPNRLEQEMLFFMQKIDVAEEIDRTETHIAEAYRILKEGGPLGRRLDFLLQELNREANTLGSKSTDSLITHAAIEIKVLIEQMREQIQNVE